MKNCTSCKQYKNIDEFGTYVHKRTNKIYINSRCKLCANRIATQHQKTNPNKKVNTSRWAIKNKDKIKIKNRKHRLANLQKYAAKEAKRRACKLQQTPKWADIKAIEQFYLNCPKGYHVDHIIPLQGKNVRGLHVLENLQYLPAKENISKKNKFEV
jgi:hypothetical protein